MFLRRLPNPINIGVALVSVFSVFLLLLQASRHEFRSMDWRFSDRAGSSSSKLMQYIYNNTLRVSNIGFTNR
jgi:hypothetical protein